jgi:hypothetical protein
MQLTTRRRRNPALDDPRHPDTCAPSPRHQRFSPVLSGTGECSARAETPLRQREVKSCSTVLRATLTLVCPPSNGSPSSSALPPIRRPCGWRTGCLCGPCAKLDEVKVLGGMGSRSGEAHQTGHVLLEGRYRRVYLLYRASAAGVAGQQPTEDVLPHTKQALSRRRGGANRTGTKTAGCSCFNAAATSSPRSSLYPPSLSNQTSTGDQREHIRPLFVAFCSCHCSAWRTGGPLFPARASVSSVEVCPRLPAIFPSRQKIRPYGSTSMAGSHAAAALSLGPCKSSALRHQLSRGNTPHRHHNQGQPWHASTRQGSFGCPSGLLLGRERWLKSCSFRAHLHTGLLPVFARLSRCGRDGNADPRR